MTQVIYLTSCFICRKSNLNKRKTVFQLILYTIALNTVLLATQRRVRFMCKCHCSMESYNNN